MSNTLSRTTSHRAVWIAVAALLAATLAGIGAGASDPRGHGAGRYIVTFADGVDPAATAEDLGITADTVYTAAVNGIAADLTATEAIRLGADAHVISLTPDVVFEGAAQTLPPHVPSVEADEAPVNAGDGVGPVWKGPAVAIIDSGVSAHVDYKLVKGVNCLPSGTADDANGHGTAVAGYMAAYDNGSGTVGIAPGAPIYSVRAKDANTKATLTSMLCAMDWVAQNAARYGIGVVNMSFGAAGTDDGACGAHNGDALHDAVCTLVNRGVLVVGSAGNNTSDLAGVVPGAYDEVLTATNVADYDGRPGGLGSPPCAVSTPDDRPSANSNYAVSAADRAHVIAAPGMCPYTTQRGNRYGIIQSGTSMSAAALSGVALNCLVAGGACEGGTPAEIRAILIDQAKAAAARGHVFRGDPITSPVAGKYYGFLASTIPGVSGPTPDTTAPTVTITSPASGAVITGTGTLVATATDNVGVATLTYWSGTTRLATATRNAQGKWVATLNSRNYPNGTYSVTARATDAAGNTGVSAPVSIVIRN